MNREEVISFSPPTPDSCDPSPLNDVAVTTPTASIPPARTLIPVRAVTIPTESTLVTSSYVRTPVNVAATPVMFLTAMSGVPERPNEVVAKETEFTPTLVNPEPSPKKLVALTIPMTSNFASGEVLLTPILLLASTVKLDGLLNFDRSLARDISQLLSSYLGHKKRPPSLLTDDLEVLVVSQKI